MIYFCGIKQILTIFCNSQEIFYKFLIYMLYYCKIMQKNPSYISIFFGKVQNFYTFYIELIILKS